jgi:hypothetical protein
VEVSRVNGETTVPQDKFILIRNYLANVESYGFDHILAHPNLPAVAATCFKNKLQIMMAKKLDAIMEENQNLWETMASMFEYINEIHQDLRKLQSIGSTRDNWIGDRVTGILRPSSGGDPWTALEIIHNKISSAQASSHISSSKDRYSPPQQRVNQMGSNQRKIRKKELRELLWNLNFKKQ